MYSSKSALESFFKNVCISPQLVAIELNEQIWTYSELLINVTRVTHHLEIEPNEIVFQYVDRSLEMVCGLLGIMCAGGVYCPISVANSPARISSLLEDIQGRFVLVHGRTRDGFSNIDNQHVEPIDLDRLFLQELKGDVIHKGIYLDENSPSFMICTSGTTSRQKGVVHTHGSLAAHLQSLLDCGIQHGDKVLQQCASSWIIHINEILLPLTARSPGTIVLLEPGDNWNVIRLAKTIKEKQITVAMSSSPTLKTLLDYLELNNHESDETLAQLRIWRVLGESASPKYLVKLKSLAPQIRIFASYGSTEQGPSLGYYVDQDISELSNLIIVPLGYPLSSYRYLLVSDVDERIIRSSNSNQTGQIHVAGHGLFQCYYNDPELSDRVRVTLDNAQFFKTGDLARYNASGELVYVGRIDFQIKINGQRMESSEVETVLMQIVRNCVVVKVTHLDSDLLVAYVETKKTSHDLRQYCLSRLPLYMVPSFFMILDKMALNQNGKIDRHSLPSPDFSLLSLPENMHQQPQTDMEMQVLTLWRQVLVHLNLISTSRSVFEIGGTSMTIMKLFYLYQITFKRNVNIGDLFRQSTIVGHAHLLEQQAAFKSDLCVWPSLNRNQDKERKDL